jgi:hypothetical protein
MSCLTSSIMGWFNSISNVTFTFPLFSVASINPPPFVN